jgi:hypothetical protein
MRMSGNRVLLLSFAPILSACGTVVPEMPEIWDRADPLATQHMEMQIKRAVYCELRDAIAIARGNPDIRHFEGKNVTAPPDLPLPDSWGIQATFTFQVDETSKFTPGVSFNSVRPTAITTFFHQASVMTPQSFVFGLGGTLSSEATRIDTYDTFYTVGDIAYIYSQNNVCDYTNSEIMGPDSHSSLLVVRSELGIKEWLPQAFKVSSFLRSSRSAENGEGPPLTINSYASDSISYNIKYIITTDLNATPTWKLVNVSANTSGTLFDTSRVRTHQLLITIGPGSIQKSKTPNGTVINTYVFSQSALNSHLAQQIGASVAAQLPQAPLGGQLPQ